MSELANIAVGFGVVMCVWALILQWRYLVMQWSRLRLFELRDELHQMADDGKTVRDAEYRMVRSRINMSIRAMHTITLPTMAYWLWFSRREDIEVERRKFSNPVAELMFERVNEYTTVAVLMRAPGAVLLFVMRHVLRRRKGGGDMHHPLIVPLQLFATKREGPTYAV